MRALLGALIFLTLGAPTTLAKPGEGANSDGNPVFLVRPDGQGGPLVGYDTATGAARFTWPAGFLTPDGRRYFAAAAQGDATSIDVYDPRGGTFMERFVIDGAWELRGVSATGSWLGLRRIPTAAELAAWQAGNDRQTDLAVMDTVSSRITHEIHLDGNFDVDGLSVLGDSLYLIQHIVVSDGEHYLVRLYDLWRETLRPNPLRDKRSPDDVMTGEAWDGVASVDGQWQLTLYLNTKHHSAFVHSLNLQERYPVCIDLPSGNGDLAKLRAYALTMAPDGMHAYAANPVLGQLAELDLSSWQIGHVVSFPAVTPPPTGERRAAHSLLSADGRMLYFTAGRVVWAYDTVAGTIGNSYLAPPVVTGLGLNV
jgi:hypothetical protein